MHDNLRFVHQGQLCNEPCPNLWCPHKHSLEQKCGDSRHIAHARLNAQTSHSRNPDATIVKKDLYRLLPAGVTHIRTLLHYRIRERDKDEKAQDSREENVTCKKPPRNPSH
eukprot:3918169-Amphidinium_carterae.2